MLGGKSRDRDLVILIYDSRPDFVRVHFPSIWEATSVTHRSVGIGTCLDVYSISLQNVFGHRRQAQWTVDLEWHRAACCPSTEDQVRITGCVIGVKVGYKCHFQISRFNCGDPSFESSRLSAPHNAGSEIDKVGGVVYNDSGRWARTI